MAKQTNSKSEKRLNPLILNIMRKAVRSQLEEGTMLYEFLLEQVEEVGFPYHGEGVDECFELIADKLSDALNHINLKE